MMIPLRLIKKISVLILAFMALEIFFSCRRSYSAQDSLVGEHKDSKVWSRRRQKKESKNDQPYNPILHGKGKNKPSSVEARENARVVKNAKKQVRKEKRRLRRTKGAYRSS